ncbi:MAG: hypothetical protein D3921_15805, partial [Candidatus Electrothrix sp. AW1]|nr:hypothetical protein [Candidatus Electrothrix gigas]
WQNAFPEEVLTLWQRAFTEEWDEKNNLIWRAVSSLDKFQHWHVIGIDSLLENLLTESNDTHSLGEAISQYISATGQGDDLLWRFITKDLSSEDVSKWDIGQKLHCDDHDFHQKDFLEQRLLASEYLLDLALNDLQAWMKAGVHEYEKSFRPYSGFLRETSWRQKHEKSIQHIDDLTILLNLFEQTIKHHAKENTTWWQENEPQLRQSCSAGILYFLIVAYLENPEANADTIAVFLADKKLLSYGKLKYELGELARTSFHLLNDLDQELFQRTILSLYDDEDWGEERWVLKKKYDYLICIPAIFRLPEVQHFIEQLSPTLDSPLPMPQIYSRGGCWGGSPISLENLLSLSNLQLYRLLLHYDGYSDDHSSHPADHFRGGQEEITRTLSEAAAYDPLRYFSLLPEFEKQGLNSSYIVSILQGIGNHLLYRFGNVKPAGKEWKHIEPPPNGLAIAETLINSAEQFPPLWQDGYGISHIIEACCEVVEDTPSAERLVFLLFRLRKHPNPEKCRSDLRFDAINCVRGVAAGATMTLCNRLLKKEIELPELLFPLLRHYALDHVLSVRAALMNGLPFLTSKRHAWGWQLFEDIFRDAPTLLWPLAERHLYHQYHNHFDKVSPCLDRIQQEAPHEAGEAWGRIATLSSLAGHLSQDSLFAQLEQADQPKQWKGAAQVFAAN